MLMTSASLSDEAKKDLPFHLKGNLCRCTGYHSIEDAIKGIPSVDEDKAGHVRWPPLRTESQTPWCIQTPRQSFSQSVKPMQHGACPGH